MKGKIVSIQEILNNDLTVNCYEVKIDFVEPPPFRLGDCFITKDEGRNKK